MRKNLIIIVLAFILIVLVFAVALSLQPSEEPEDVPGPGGFPTATSTPRDPARYQLPTTDGATLTVRPLRSEETDDVIYLENGLPAHNVDLDTESNASGDVVYVI